MLNNFYTNDPLPCTLTLIMCMRLSFVCFVVVRLIFVHSIEYESILTMKISRFKVHVHMYTVVLVVMNVSETCLLMFQLQLKMF